VTRTAAAILLLGAATLVTGISLVSLPAAVIAAGLLLICAGVLSLEPKPKSERP
jgi:hypothetical protein